MPKEFQRVKRVMQEIYDHFPEQLSRLKRAADGDPWAFDCNVPEHWSWWSLWDMFSHRIQNMY